MSRLLALFLAFILTLPNLALALRPQNGGLEEVTPTVHAIEDRLRGDDPTNLAGLEEEGKFRGILGITPDLYDSQRSPEVQLSDGTVVSLNDVQSVEFTLFGGTVRSPAGKRVGGNIINFLRPFRLSHGSPVVLTYNEDATVTVGLKGDKRVVPETVGQAAVVAAESPGTPTSQDNRQAEFQRLLQGNPRLQQGLLGKHWAPLSTVEVGKAFGVKGMVGMIVQDSAPVTDAAHVIVSSDTLRNPAAEGRFSWIRLPGNIPEVVRASKDLLVRPGDLFVFGAQEGLSASAVEDLLAVQQMDGVRALIGTEQEVDTLPVFAFQLFADPDQKWLPPVVVLSVALRLKDEAGNTYTLILMA